MDITQKILIIITTLFISLTIYIVLDFIKKVVTKKDQYFQEHKKRGKAQIIRFAPFGYNENNEYECIYPFVQILDLPNQSIQYAMQSCYTDKRWDSYTAVRNHFHLGDIVEIDYAPIDCNKDIYEVRSTEYPPLKDKDEIIKNLSLFILVMGIIISILELSII